MVAAAEQVETTIGGEVVGEAPDVSTPVTKAKKPNKIDLKKQQIFIDRLKRKLTEKDKDGKPKTQQQCLAEMNQEDYDRLPTDQKLRRLEANFGGFARQNSNDMQNLRRNDGAIADAFDINYTAIKKMFTLLGLTDEQQKTCVIEAESEFKAARQAKIDADAQAAAERFQKAKEADEQRRMEIEAAKKPAEIAKDEPAAVDPHIADGATVFQG